MSIPVTCVCKHTTQAPESRAGLSILCENCGRTLLVPRPAGLDSGEIRAARRREAEEGEAPAAWRLILPRLKALATEHKMRSVVVFLSLAFIAVAAWLIFSVHTGMQDGVDRLRKYTGEDIRAKMRADRQYQQQQTATQPSGQPEPSAGATRPQEN